MKSFIHLHNHSDFSLLDSSQSIKSIVDRAKSLSMDKGGVLVAVWQDGDRVVRLFAGGDEFVPVKL